MKALTPTWCSPPGETIADLLEARGWDQEQLAARMQVDAAVVGALLEGGVVLTDDLAEALAEAFGATPRFWVRREARYRAALKAREGAAR